MIGELERWEASAAHDKAYNSREIIAEIPHIKFPEGWQVKILPPFTGATARFSVKKDENNSVSVYLDYYCMLGMFNGPHWEIYPYWYKDDEGKWSETNHRISMNETEELVRCIQQSLDYKETL